jgi:REP-associated tyrosine transposase
VRYIHLNPLRAKVVKDIKELGKYRWSGHSVLMGKAEVDFQDTKVCFEIVWSVHKTSSSGL